MSKSAKRSRNRKASFEDELQEEIIAALCAMDRDPFWKDLYNNATAEAQRFVALFYILLFDEEFSDANGDALSDRLNDASAGMTVADWEYVIEAIKRRKELKPMLGRLKEELACAKKREGMKDDECLRAFTVHPGWAWAIMKGLKKQEWRTFLPNPREGMCAIHVSKSYGRAQWEREAAFIEEQWGRKLIPYEELAAEWCGKVVGVCNYAASEDDWDEDAYGWRLTKVRPLRNRIACPGALKLWKMDAALAKKVLAEV